MPDMDGSLFVRIALNDKPAKSAVMMRIFPANAMQPRGNKADSRERLNPPPRLGEAAKNSGAQNDWPLSAPLPKCGRKGTSCFNSMTPRALIDALIPCKAEIDDHIVAIE
jgi:hypothetical protein